MGTTIALSSSSHRELSLLKIEEGYRTMDELIHKLIIEYKKNKLIKASQKIRGRMKELNLTISDLIK